MSTITPTQALTTLPEPRSSLPLLPVQGDQRTVFRGVDWHTYNSLSEAIGEGQHVRLAYDGKDLEIIVTSNVHENWKVSNSSSSISKRTGLMRRSRQAGSCASVPRTFSAG
jgi:hypothetical protein